MSNERTVAVLCAAPHSVYKSLPNVDVFDKRRDAHTFGGGSPVVAHPPCRSWSRWMRHWAQPEPGEQSLGLWCVKKVRECGGVLEQPRLSLLWEAANLPKPGDPTREWFALEVWQCWWGYPTRKGTWLLFSGIAREDLPEIPFRLHAGGRDKDTFERMSHAQRSATQLEFARWLIAAARVARGSQ